MFVKCNRPYNKPLTRDHEHRAHSEDACQSMDISLCASNSASLLLHLICTSASLLLLLVSLPLSAYLMITPPPPPLDAVVLLFNISVGRVYPECHATPVGNRSLQSITCAITSSPFANQSQSLSSEWSIRWTSITRTEDSCRHLHEPEIHLMSWIIHQSATYADFTTSSVMMSSEELGLRHPLGKTKRWKKLLHLHVKAFHSQSSNVMTNGHYSRDSGT